MTRSGKAVLVFGLLLFWGLAVWLVFRSVAPTPGEKYEEWLAARRHGGVAGSRLEMWANRFGITYFANARRERDRRLTGELLVEADYAVAVASWRDSTGGIAPGLQPTWPHVRKSLEEMTGGADAERLEAALARADAAGFATWELTIARSAHRSGALDELAPIVRTLREFEQAHQPGSHRMASLQRIYELYALTPAGFARALVEETDPGAEALLYLVMGDLGVPPERAHGALVSEWKTGGFPEADWGMPARILKDARVGSFRLGFFTWLALGRESEEWRKRHRATIGDLLEEFRRTEPAFAKECASSLVREITKEGAELASDWNFVAGILLSKIDPEPDLESWIGNEVGSDFVWLCHSVNAEGLLNRALEIWGDQVPHRSFWIGHFIDAGHYAAVCALIEGAKGDLHSIRSQKETYQEEKAKKLDEYLALGERIWEHSNEDQVKGFIRLELGIKAMRNLHRTPEEEAAKQEVLAAIEMLNEAETFNPYLLERTVALVVEMADEFFASARPCFDKWRGAVTPDMVVDRVVRGDFQEDERGYEIWSKYFRNFVTMSELPSLEGTVVGLIRRLPQDETAGHGLDRLEEFLGVGRGNSKPAGTYLGVWVGRRFIEARRWEDAAGWMFDRIEDHHARNPDVDMVRLVQGIYDEMNRGLREENVADHLDWLGAVLADKRSELYSWPATLTFFFRDTAADPAEIIDRCHIRFGQHPLRRWIARNLFGYHFPNLDKRPDQLSGILELTEHSWVREVIKESFDKTFDLDAFERDFETASPGARRFFLRNPVVYWRNRRPPRHPDGRDFTKEEVARLLVWEARQAIEIMERREYFESQEFVRIFTDLIAEAETRPDDPVIRPLFERLQAIVFEAPWPGLDDFGFKSLRELQARALPYSKGISETQNLLTNSSLPVTERVWKLALKEEFAAARKLMEENPDRLDYGIPKGIKRGQLGSSQLAAFRNEFSPNEQLGIYVSVFLSGLRDYLPVYGSLSYVNLRWPYSVSNLTNYEADLRELVLPFESSVFVNTKLERQTTVLLGSLMGAPALMPGKLASLRMPDAVEYQSEILPLLDFDARLAEGNCREIRCHLAELSESGGWESSGRPVHAFEVLEYHLWRRALLGLEITVEQRDAIKELCFSTEPFRELEPSGRDISGPYRMVRRDSRMYPLHLALEMIERVPNKSGNWTWSDFEGLDFDRYRDSEGFHANLFGGAIAVLARQCRDWDEEARWSLIGVFEEPLPGDSERPQVVRGLAMFNAGGFVKEEEVVRRARDFVSRYPASGWNYHTVWRLGRQYGDESLAAFGRAGAEPYFGENPGLQKLFDTNASKAPAP